MRGAKSALRRGSRGKPVAFGTLLRLRRFGGRRTCSRSERRAWSAPGTALASPYLAERLSDRSRLGPRVREVEIPGVSVAGVVLVGHGVLVGDYRPRSKTQP